MGQINMRDTRVDQVEHISDSDSDEQSRLHDKSVPQPTIGIFPNHVHQGPTYLIFPSRAEQEKWLYQLTLVSGGDPKAGTQFEQLVQKLMEEDGDQNSLIWRHSLMTHSKEPPTSTLTTFTSEITPNRNCIGYDALSQIHQHVTHQFELHQLEIHQQL